MNDKIKGLCIKVELKLEENGFVTEQRSEFIFQTSIPNRLTEMEDSIHNTTTSEGIETSFLPMIFILKFQCANFSGINL